MQTLTGKRVAFCGRLVNEKRKMVIAKLEMLGGRCVERVSSRTDILVLPHDYDASNKTKQLLEAEELQKKGTLTIMSEREFLDILCQ